MSKKEEKKLIRFASEELNLLCEWEDCQMVETVMDNFTVHLYTAHLSNLTDGDLNCHWKDCQGFTLNLAELRRHILFHAFHTKIKCYGRNLQDRKGLPRCVLSIQSRNLIPELPDPLVCYWEDCKQEFECPEYFYRHVETHAEFDSRREKDSTAECFWHDCNRVFSDHNKVKDHLRSHTQEKLMACPTCGGVFASRTKFFDHIQRQNVSIDENMEAAYICEYCSRKMSSERLLRDHMRHHVNHYKCPYCDMTCPTPSGMQSHITYRHSQEKPHSCQYCDYKCKSQNDLRKHLESHSLIPTFKCTAAGCEYATRSQTCYTSHYKKTHEDKSHAKYSCHLCDKICTRGNYLTKHLLNKHKFQWPSGHCRFRYHMDKDGFFRLQTVRYESLELTQSILCDDAEELDNPNIVITGSIPGSEIEPFRDKIRATDASTTGLKILNQYSPNNTSTIIGDNVVYYVQSGTGTEYQQVTPNVQCTNSSEEPVLIQIIEADSGLASSFGSSVVLLKVPNQDGVHQSVESIIQNPKDQLNFSQIIAQAEQMDSAVVNSESNNVESLVV